MSFCEEPVAVPDQFLGAIFENTNAIEFMHNVPPRYGSTSDLNAMIQGTEDERKEYLRGMLAASITIFCIFALWMFFLLAFKCVGPYVTGCLSGRRLPLPRKPESEQYDDEEEYETELEAWNRNYARVKTVHTVVKGIVLIAGLSIIICATLSTMYG